MRGLVVYYTKYGNGHIIAESIAGDRLLELAVRQARD
jgi:menaquinone-dependent protoporphyrinogen IX oxidase